MLATERRQALSCATAPWFDCITRFLNTFALCGKEEKGTKKEGADGRSLVTGKRQTELVELMHADELKEIHHQNANEFLCICTTDEINTLLMF